MTCICLFLSIAIALWTIVRAIRLRHRFSLCVSNVLAGVFFTIWSLALPTYLQTLGIVPAVLSSMLFSLKSMGGGQNVTQLEAVALEGALRIVYLGVGYTAFFIAPLMTSSLLISFVGDIGDKIRYALSLSRECHVFSELNERSIILAESIDAKDPRVRLVFCSAKKPEEALAQRARKLGAVLLHGDITSVSPLKRFKKFSLYAISMEDDKNISAAAAIMEHYRNSKFFPDLMVLSTGNTNSAILESIPRGKIRLRVIDEIAVYCCNLLLENPLYDTSDPTADLSVAIVGCGRQGMQLLKTVVWCGQLADRHLKIRVFDTNEKTEHNFLSHCPELHQPEYDIQFFPSDAACDDFTALMQEHCSDATHIFLCMKEDDLNLATATMLRGFFMHCNESFHHNPQIFARVRTPLKSQNLLRGSAFLEERSISLFGSMEQVYSVDALLNSQIEQLGLSVHMCFGGQALLDKGKQHPDYQQELKKFYDSEYNRRSSMASALHIQSKLHACGLMPAGDHTLTEEKAAAFQTLLDADTQGDLVLRLGQLEHARWNAFMRSYGYRSVSTDKMKLYAKKGEKKSHIHPIAKLHPCITDWEKLDEVSKAYTECTGFNKDFQEDDFVVVRNIPMIIRNKGQL